MGNNRYDYQAIIERKKLRWPNKAKIALWVCPNIEYFYIDKPVSRADDSHLPDVRAYSLRDYGNRVGVFRIMDVLDKYGIRASVALNADICDEHRTIIEEGKKRNWEWLGHGLTNNHRLSAYHLEDERSIIRQVSEKIANAVGTPPKGWLSPGLLETLNTPDHLAAEGFEYLCDWNCDDQPIPLRVRTGRMIAISADTSISDIAIFLRSNHTAEEYLQQVRDHFDTLYEEGAENGRVMALCLHPFIIGIPSRIRYLDKALEYICSHEDVWLTTGWEIADWYYRHYYVRPEDLC